MLRRGCSGLQVYARSATGDARPDHWLVLRFPIRYHGHAITQRLLDTVCRLHLLQRWDLGKNRVIGEIFLYMHVLCSGDTFLTPSLAVTTTVDANCTLAMCRTPAHFVDTTLSHAMCVESPVHNIIRRTREESCFVSKLVSLGQFLISYEFSPPNSIKSNELRGKVKK
jgi:hypothetical protein